jgi:hypothetical protein
VDNPFGDFGQHMRSFLRPTFRMASHSRKQYNRLNFHATEKID